MSQSLRSNLIPAEILQLVPGYLAGTLARADADAFEEYCILHPEVAMEVEHERMLREGMLAVHQSQAAPGAAPRTGEIKAARRVGLAPRLRWTHWLAVAASIAAVVIAVKVLQAPREAAGPLLARIDSNLASGQAGTSPQLTLLTLRGRAPVLEVSATDRFASIELQPDPAAPGESYQLSLEQLDASEHWLPLGSLTATADPQDGSLSVALQLSQLHEGRLRLTARPEGSSAQAASAEFLLRRTAEAGR